MLSWFAIDPDARGFADLLSTQICLSITAFAHPNLGPIRALRSLRILRGVARFEGSKVATSALISTLPTAFNVGLVVLLFWILFALVGVKLFQGAFHYCSDSSVTQEALCGGTCMSFAFSAW